MIPPLPFTPHYDIFGGELYFSPRQGCPRVLKLCMQPFTYQKNKIKPLNKSMIPPHSTLLILHPPFFTLNQTSLILHFESFNFQPYIIGRCLTWKKPFCLYLLMEWLFSPIEFLWPFPSTLIQNCKHQFWSRLGMFFTWGSFFRTRLNVLLYSLRYI